MAKEKPTHLISKVLVLGALMALFGVSVAVATHDPGSSPPPGGYQPPPSGDQPPPCPAPPAPCTPGNYPGGGGSQPGGGGSQPGGGNQGGGNQGGGQGGGGQGDCKKASDHQPPSGSQPNPPSGGGSQPGGGGSQPGPGGSQPGGGNQGGGNSCGGKGGGGNEGGNSEPPAEHKFHPGFGNRVLQFTADCDSLEGKVLSVTIKRFSKLPKKFEDDEDAVVGEDARIKVKKTTRIYDDGKKGNLSDLENCEKIKVRATMVKNVDDWVEEDGDPLFTLNAKRIYLI